MAQNVGCRSSLQLSKDGPPFSGLQPSRRSRRQPVSELRQIRDLPVANVLKQRSTDLHFCKSSLRQVKVPVGKSRCNHASVYFVLAFFSFIIVVPLRFASVLTGTIAILPKLLKTVV